MSKYYQLKICLAGAESKVWRSFVVEADIRLDKFQKILRCVMGWSGVYEHYFKIKDGWKHYIPELKEDSEFDYFSYEDMVLSDFLQKNKDVLVYVYDLSDQWEHYISIEKHHAGRWEQRNPYCISGQGVCPPEDCGGIWGYLQMMKVMQDPYSTEYENVKKWLGEWVNRQFSCNDVNNHFDDAGLYNERVGLPGIPDVKRVSWSDIMYNMSSKCLMENCHALELPGVITWSPSKLAIIIMNAIKKRPILLAKILSRDDLEYLKYLLDARTVVKWNKGDKSAARLVKFGMAAFHHDGFDEQLYVYTTPELGTILEPHWCKMLDSPQVELYDRWDRIVCGILFYYGVLSSDDLHSRWSAIVPKPLTHTDFIAYLKKRTRLRSEVLLISKQGVTYCCHYMMDNPEDRLEEFLNDINLNYQSFTAEEFYEAGSVENILESVEMQKLKMYLELHIADARLVKNLVIESWSCMQNNYLSAKSVKRIFGSEIAAGILKKESVIYQYKSVKHKLPCWICRGHRRDAVMKVTNKL